MIAGQFSRGKELREHEFYYETIPLLILVGQMLGQSPSRKYRSSTKCEALFGFNSVFFVFVFTSIGTKKGRIFIRGAPFQKGATAVWRGQLPQTAPPLDPPLVWDVFLSTFHRSKYSSLYSRQSPTPDLKSKLTYTLRKFSVYCVYALISSFFGYTWFTHKQKTETVLGNRISNGFDDIYQG